MAHQASHAKIADELERYQTRRIQRYTCVVALLLYWKETDLKIDGELQALEDLLQDTFNYNVERYAIPSEKSQRMLCSAVNKFLDQYGTSDNLVIVYYGGHGGPTKDGSTECEWAAYNNDSLTVDWSAIQPQLLTAECDVVILLDCCFAGSAVRGKTRRYVEILLATDDNQMTPTGSGKWPSFTKILTQKMREIMERDQEINLRSLHSHLVPADTGLRRQPILVSGRDSAGNIVMRKCVKSSLPLLKADAMQSNNFSLSQDQKFLLEVYTHRPLESTVLDSIINWLTKGSPSSVVDIRLAEQIVSDTTTSRSIGVHLLRNSLTGDRGRSLIPLRSRNELDGLVQELDETAKAPSPQHLTDQEAMNLVKRLKEKSHGLNTMIEDLMASLEQPQLELLVAEKMVDNANLGNRIKLRLTLLNESRPVKIPNHAIGFTDQAHQDQRFRVGTLKDSQVLVEYCYYEETDDTNQSVVLKKVARMSALLLEPKPASFRTLPAVGYTHERLIGPRFGFIYQSPQKQNLEKYAVLSDLIEKVGHVPLESRISMSRVLCEAMLQLHSIGWYHKAIRSSNVLLFGTSGYKDDKRNSALAYRFDEPYLVGFDCSRPVDAETRQTVDFTKEKLYRHPDRWGTPTRFKSHHDLYALGILLLEIGCWRLLPQMDSKKKNFEWIKDPEHLREHMLSKALDRLAHYAGTSYASAVRVCLQKEQWEGMEEWQLQREVRENVLARLRIHVLED